MCVWYTDNRFDCLGIGLGKINHDQWLIMIMLMTVVIDNGDDKW